MRTHRIICLSWLFLAVLGGCASEENKPSLERLSVLVPWALDIRSYYGASGIGYWYDIDGNALIVIRKDSTDDPPQVVYETLLTSAQQKSLADVVASIPLSELKQSYWTHGLLDGFWIVFRIPCDEDTLRQIVVSNYVQPDLVRLAEFVDALVPEEHRLNYGREE